MKKITFIGKCQYLDNNAFEKHAPTEQNGCSLGNLLDKESGGFLPHKFCCCSFTCSLFLECVLDSMDLSNWHGIIAFFISA